MPRKRRRAAPASGPLAKFLLALALLAIAVSAQAIPAIEKWQTKNGARVYFVAAPELPMVDIEVVFDAGSARDRDEPGVASLTNDLLGEGAGNLNADEIAARFDDVGAQFGSSSLRDMGIVTLRSLTDPSLLEQALDTFALVLTKPTFPQDAFERERQRTLVALRAEQESPGDLAEKAFYRAIYGDHPYASPPLGTEESVKALKREDLITYHRRYYVAKNAIVAIVGALDRPAAEKLVNKIIGDLPAGEAAPPLPPVKALNKPQQITQDYPSTQSHVLIGQPGITRHDDNYFPLYVGNHALGGSGLTSMIAEEVREKRGLSYSSYSYFIPMRARGPFIMGLQTRNDQTKEAITVIDDVLKDFIKDGIDEDKLEAAKKNLTGGFALRLASNSKIVGQLGGIGFYDLPLDYLDNYIANINAVTAKQVNDAFRHTLHPADLVTVIVGGNAGH